MCGISGFIPLDDTISKDKIFEVVTFLLEENQTRGRQATGIASYDLKADEIHVFKAAADATEFKKHLKSENIKGPTIGHNRMPTTGSPEKPDNNHPMYGKEWCLVHNGVLTIPEEKEYKYKGECDTERLLAIIELYGIETAIPKIKGSAAIALFNAKTREFYLYKHDNPLNLLYIPGKAFAFSSLESPLKKITDMLGEKKIFGMFSPGYLKDFDEGEFVKIDLDTKEVEHKKIEVPTTTGGYCNGGSQRCK